MKSFEALKRMKQDILVAAKENAADSDFSKLDDEYAQEQIK